MKKNAIILMCAALALTGCGTIKEKISDWWKTNPPEIPVPEKPAPDKPSDPEAADAVSFENLRWTRGGDDFSKAVRVKTCIIRNVRIKWEGPPTLFYSGEGFKKWPKREEDISHIWAVFFDEDNDGVYERGGKFDWGRDSFLKRPMHHLTFYKGWDGYPAKGTPWAAVATDIQGKRRSNTVKGVWP